jgi:hypothetical protein
MRPSSKLNATLAITLMLSGCKCEPDRQNAAAQKATALNLKAVQALASILTVRPNSPVLAGGYLEFYQYFTTSDPEIKHGLITCAQSPGGCTIIGKLKDPVLPGYDEIPVHVTLVNHDPCVRDHNSVEQGSNSVIADVPLYTVKWDLGNGPTKDLCEKEDYRPAPDERNRSCNDAQLSSLNGKAIALPGYFDKDGKYHEAVGNTNVFTLACITGVAAKCIHWGYPLWKNDYEVSSKNSKTQIDNTLHDLNPYYFACVGAARARYCKNTNMAFTCDTSAIDMYDRIGLQQVNDLGSDKQFESIWGKNGLICMSLDHARWPHCERQIGACLREQTTEACPNTNDEIWGKYGDALIGILKVRNPNPPKKCDGGPECDCDGSAGEACCVNDQAHCPTY